MLVRFRQDVIGLQRKVVVTQTGTNDLASVMGPSPILASVTPVCDCVEKLSSQRPAGKILSMNGWLKCYAKESGSVYLDYYSALVTGRAMNKDLTVDGLVPNDAGYERMAPWQRRPSPRL